MIQTLRRRFILTAMLSLMGTLFLIGIAINLGNLFRIIRLADTAIELLTAMAAPSLCRMPLSPMWPGGSRSRRRRPLRHVTASSTSQKRER